MTSVKDGEPAVGFRPPGQALACRHLETAITEDGFSQRSLIPR